MLEKLTLYLTRFNMTRLDANVVGTSLGYVEHNQTESRKSARPSFCWICLCLLSLSRVDVLWCQLIKLIQVISTSEFHEYWWNNIDFICPLHLLQGLRSHKHWLLQNPSMKILDQKFKLIIKKLVFRCPNILKTWIFWPLKTHI